MIQNQVRLPFRVAFDVVLQGIRIRFGRSLITVFGVVFGIAFLSSILTGIALKRGVAEEDALRAEVDRLLNFLVAETGPLRDRVVGLHLAGPLNAAEERLVVRLEAAGLSALRWSGAEPSARLAGRLGPERRAEAAALAADASAVLVLGGGDASRHPWGEWLAGARQNVLAPTRGAQFSAPPAGVNFVRLERAPDAEETAAREAAAARDRFRNLWIILISLLVTVIGIANAMLMSVTERFREIGTMKCLGALSSFIRRLFLIESALMGVAGGLVGCLIGALFSLVAYGFTYGFALAWGAFAGGLGQLSAYLGLSVVAGVVLSVLAALYPATVASRMVPAHALRSNV